MTKFWELLERSVILQAALTLIFAVVICYLVVVDRDIPEIVAYALSSILGFYFGSKVQSEVVHRAGIESRKRRED